MPTIPAAKIHVPLEDRRRILADIDECLATGALTLGRHGRAFEEAFARRVSVKYAVAVNSGTSAIEIPLRVLGVRDKEVLVPTNTFFATPAAVLHAGGRVRWVDTDPHTLGIDVENLRRQLTPRTVGVIAVHIAGMVTPAMPQIESFCREHGLFLFEDAAHAHGSLLGERPAGTFGCAASFSFYPTKVMTSGEGGMIVTDDQAIYEEALQYRDQGKAGFHTNLHQKLGYNWRMSELHAVVGLSQLGRLDEFISERRRVAAEYDRRLAGLEGIRPVKPDGACASNYYKYVAYLAPGIDRSAVKRTLKSEFGVSLSGEVYDTPCHRQPVFQDLVDDAGPLPGAEEACARHVCLPVFVGMTEPEIAQVVSALGAVLQRRSER